MHHVCCHPNLRHQIGLSRVLHEIFQIIPSTTHRVTLFRNVVSPSLISLTRKQHFRMKTGQRYKLFLKRQRKRCKSLTFGEFSRDSAEKIKFSLHSLLENLEFTNIMLLQSNYSKTDFRGLFSQVRYKS